MSKKTPLSQGFISRVAAGVRYAFTGNADGWFDAGEPSHSRQRGGGLIMSRSTTSGIPSRANVRP